MTENGSRRSYAQINVQIDEHRIDSIFADLNQCFLPGVAVGVAVNGRPVYRKGFGLACMELPCTLSTSTRMRIGSTSKQFTALAFLLLCEDGSACLEDPLGKYFPDFTPGVHSVTMRQLLGHTSGIIDAMDLRFRLGGLEGRPVTCSEILALYRTITDTNASPGSTWLYNNAGYMLIGSAVELVSGHSLHDFLWTRVFSPIGMYDTSLRPSDTTFTPHTATPHTLIPDGRFQRRFWGVEFGGAGSILSTVDDLLRWLAHMSHPIVGSKNTWATMLAQQTLSNGTATGYGGGLIRSTYRDLDTINHGGGWIGGNAQILKVPALDLDIVVISNRSDVFSPVLANQILDSTVFHSAPTLVSHNQPKPDERFSVFRAPHKVTAPTLDVMGDLGMSVKHLTGTYRSLKTGRIVQMFPENDTQIVSIDGHDLPYERDARGDLVPIPVWSHVKRHIELTSSDDISKRIRLIDFGEADELTRIEVAPEQDHHLVTGNYTAKNIGAVARITLGEGGARLRFDSSFGSSEYSLSHICEHTWRSTSPHSSFLDAVLVFDDTCDAFRIFSYNLRGGLLFTRVVLD